MGHVVGALLAATLFVTAHAAEPGELDAPNVVEISETLVISGQPTPAALKQLAAQGFGAVIYLVPTGKETEVVEESRIVVGQGLVFVHIPIDFRQPTAADFKAFSGTLAALSERKVLVHCQVNFRASSMTFLYRVLTLGESPDHALPALRQVWAPDAVWTAYINAKLARAGVDFELF